MRYKLISVTEGTDQGKPTIQVRAEITTEGKVRHDEHKNPIKTDKTETFSTTIPRSEFKTVTKYAVMKKLEAKYKAHLTQLAAREKYKDLIGYESTER